MIDEETARGEAISLESKIENETMGKGEALEINLHNDYMQILKPVAFFSLLSSFSLILIFNFVLSYQVTVLPSFVSRETFACARLLEGKRR
jgi:hypothetical protein